MRYRPAPLPGMPLNKVEIKPDRCPNGHTRFLPGWQPCQQRGHRRWDCTDCEITLHDADCPCGQQPAWPAD